MNSVKRLNVYLTQTGRDTWRRWSANTHLTPRQRRRHERKLTRDVQELLARRRAYVARLESTGDIGAPDEAPRAAPTNT
jgi:hypothetical protein